MYTLNERKFDDISNPYEKFLLTKMLKLTKQEILNIILYALFVIVLWPFHVILIALGYFYNK